MENNTVEQCDRECAVRIMADRWISRYRETVLAGEHDNWIPVQEAASHRLASQAPLLARIETLEAALEEIADADVGGGANPYEIARNALGRKA